MSLSNPENDEEEKPKRALLDKWMEIPPLEMEEERPSAELRPAEIPPYKPPSPRTLGEFIPFEEKAKEFFKPYVKGEEIKKYYPEEPEYQIDKWYVFYAPHYKDTPFIFHYQVKDGWNTRNFESLEAVRDFIRKGRGRIYIHAIRGDGILNWKPVTIPDMRLAPKKEQFSTPDGTIYLDLVQPLFDSEHPTEWIWKISEYDDKTRLSSQKDVKESDLIEYIEHLTRRYKPSKGKSP